MSNTEELIEKIIKWKNEKDNEEYLKKVEEENKTYDCIKKIKTDIYGNLIEALKVFKVLKALNIGISSRYGEIYFDYRGKKSCIELIFTNNKRCYIKEDDNNITFYDNLQPTTPPKSDELKYFIEHVDNYLKEFYNTVDEILES